MRFRVHLSPAGRPGTERRAHCIHGAGIAFQEVLILTDMSRALVAWSWHIPLEVWCCTCAHVRVSGGLASQRPAIKVFLGSSTPTSSAGPFIALNVLLKAPSFLFSLGNILEHLDGSQTVKITASVRVDAADAPLLKHQPSSWCSRHLVNYVYRVCRP
jgi:hypothetical protein